MAHAPLHPDARSFLAREVGRAREIAEKGARASLTALAVADKVVPAHFTDAQRKLRNRLRAHARQLGDERTADGQQEVNLLTEEVAYQHWHRMLFARFLAENGLLREDEGDQPIDLDECRALAADRRLDIWVYAALCAQKMLPGVFRMDDPALELKLDGAAQVELNGLMAGLQPEIFKATDALGWVYQYWQAKRKDEVNASGVKIGAKELSPVTQLFTEDYMVDFLLHNTLGAWWAGKMGPIEAATEEEARAKAGLPSKAGLPAAVWTYLRFVQDSETNSWTPAGGTFDGWPKKAKDITFLDPCMGSGHFPVFALPILARMRMEEEGGTTAENTHSVLKDQIHGLELDQRCCQIGAFNLALSAWKLGGHQQLPVLNVACCGIAPQAKLADWVSLAAEDEKLKTGMKRLYQLFEQAPVLGSLINPSAYERDLLEATFFELKPLLEKALAQEANDDVTHEMAVTARGLAKAAEILAGNFTLVATNVPYLGRGHQEEVLMDYCECVHPFAKADLATCFVERCHDFCAVGGSSALVTPQSWLFMGSYKKLRIELLVKLQWDYVIRLGARAFETISGEVVNVVLIGFTRMSPVARHHFVGIEVKSEKGPSEKMAGLRGGPVRLVQQDAQALNPDSRIRFQEFSQGALLSGVAEGLHGQGSFDDPCFVFSYWELPALLIGWVFQQTTGTRDGFISGCSNIFRWEDGKGLLSNLMAEKAATGYTSGKWKAGLSAWGKPGVAVSGMGKFFVNLYGQKSFDTNIAVILPAKSENLTALWCFLSDDEFQQSVREIDQNLKVSCNTYVKIPFDLARWKKVADEKYPHGLPKPFSSDPTQWLFNGQPCKSDNPLQVAVARLLCYQWPRQSGSSFPDCSALGPDGLEKLADDDGVVALSSINREEAAAPRVRALLKDAYGAEWRESVTERQLLADAGHADSTLEEWLRDSFFEEHCKLFHHRPFVWHIWDGERDGFHALVNYHRLAASNGEGARLLQKLAQTYLGDWIARCEADVKNDKPNALKLLKAAKDLQADLLKILEAEAPHDIFVRWKPLHEQSIGWNPDINDGVRLNIRPFLTVRDVGKKGAGILRWKPNIKWDKDRGSEPQRSKAQFPWFWSCLPEDKPEHVTDFAGGAEFTGERWNNLHHTLAAKKAARAKFIPKK
jgi:hypothetical protein